MTLRKERLLSVGKLAVLLVAFAATIVGCHKVTGGGWIAGLNGGKATFGFEGQCRETVLDVGVEAPAFVFYEGQFQYRERGANVSIHGDVIADHRYDPELPCRVYRRCVGDLQRWSPDGDAWTGC